ncbi:uncharacterized protein LOC124912668 [Impatiens glandulifera]|uniref:uncharacterized protein LOC124912668 n=1 Tax=Impatiens glandulifera TaxID=253017 RepID=UPI001FB12496|nr:uncharacterized protein LOC124912668 [Impatiens glandulifera]
MAGTSEGQPLSWLSSNEDQHMTMSIEPNFLSQREFGCSSDPSIQTYSGYIENCRNEIKNNTNGQVDNRGQECGSLDDGSCLSMFMRDQFSYNPYSNLVLHETNKMKSETGINCHNNHHHPLDFHFDEGFGSTHGQQPIFDNIPPTQTAWIHPPDPCPISIFGQKSFEQAATTLNIGRNPIWR